ncbi:Glutathione synthase/Ribosomal protein S6 modification enzyme (glutaminyl transferase)-like [hydrothermal vent metagenome]|uniref:Glutathione synthase/Ribosomal protein S6 modification enzyme (Glutaminyl transferase)-like n=1 Tax=hydrothermal vent metagenome TaxID=652676 RepID=A0A3B1C2Y8_9ZZZZ
MKKIGVVGIENSWSSEKLAEEVNRQTGFRLLIDMAKIRFELSEGKVFYQGTDLSSLDGIIIKKIGPEYSPDLLDRLEILRFLNVQGLKIFSGPNSILRLLDRLNCTVSLKLGGIPIPATVVTEGIEEAINAVEQFGVAILKPLYTSKARGMMVIHAGGSARQEVEQFKNAGNPIMYIQKMVDIPGKDLGVVFLGGKYVATYSRCRHKDSWNTTTNNGGKYRHYDPPKETIELAHKAQALFDLDFTCVDIVETEDGPLVFEVSAFGGFRGLLEANGIDAAALYTQHVLEKLKNA